VSAVVTRALKSRSWFVRLTLGLALYLLLFSAFALYHAYANNELIDSHGCQIGEWVMHGQADVVAAICFVAGILASAVLCCLDYDSPGRYACCRLLARAPPGAFSP
jgi:hypothetical protein